MSTLPFSRLRLPLLLAMAVPCLAADRAAGGVLSSLDPARAAPAAFAQPQAVSPEPLSDAPGTPYPFNNPGGATIIIGYPAYSATPTSVSDSNIFGISSTVAGDVVMLLDPAGSNDPANWAAVFRFFNPNDPSGAEGLAADDVEGFDSDDVGPNGFAGFQLLPNTIYLADTPSSPGDHVASAEEFGPDGGIAPGQLAIFLCNVNVTGSGVINPVGGPGDGSGSVPEPATCLLIGLGGCALIAGRLRRRGCTQA